jgi:CRISPR-associated endonuclease Csn1
MHDNGCDEHDAIAQLYPSEAPTGELLMLLPPHKPTGNVVVDVALRMVRRAVNNALTTLGKPPSEVVVELSRDMALGVKARNEIETKIKKNQRRRKNARDELNRHGITATETNILRYLLWEQQDTKHCPYCTRHITIAQAVSGNETNFEHILPRSLTQVGKQRNQLVLAHRSCNDEKGNRTPFEAFHHDEDRWAAVKECATVLKANKQFAKERLLLLSDYEHETLDEATLTEFSERQFIETSWIGKLTAQWLRLTCSNVAVSRGMLTAYLRRLWKLETVIPQARFSTGLPVLDQDGNKITVEDFSRFKSFWEGHSGREHERTDRKIEKRIDHRHHLVDALVIAMTSRGLYLRMAAHYKALAERREHGEAIRLKLSVEPPLPGIRDKALAVVNEPHIAHKPDRLGGGAFFQKFAYGSTKSDNKVSEQLCRRKQLARLVAPKDKAEKARKALQEIESSEVRKLVLAAFDERIASGKTAFEALQGPIDYPTYNTKIKSANFLCGSAESAAIIAHPKIDGRHQKRLIDDGWSCLQVTMAGMSVETALISPQMFAKAGASTADKTVTYFKGDTVRDSKSAKTYVIRQIKAKSGGQLVLTPTVDAREVRDMSASEGLKTISGKGLANLTRL